MLQDTMELLDPFKRDGRRVDEAVKAVTHWRGVVLSSSNLWHGFKN